MAADQELRAPKVVFPHIMKTGGTSVNAWMQRHYAAAEVLSEASGWRELQSLPHELLLRKRLVRGHFGSRILAIFGAHNGFAAITLLREPSERVVSHFWHLKQAPDAHIEFNFVNEETFGIRDFLEHPQVRFITSDYQTGNLSGTLDAIQDHYYTPLYRSEVSPVNLDKAKEFIEACAVIGITERMDRFVADCAARFGFFPARLTARARSYSRATRLDQDVLTRLRELNSRDYELYELVKARLAVAPRVHQIIRRPNPNSIGDAEQLTWRPGEPFWGDGWSDVMYGPAAHVWSTDTTATFEVAVRASHSYILLVSVFRFVVPCQSQGFSVLCDGRAVPTTEVKLARTADSMLFAAALGKSAADRLTIGFRVNMLTAFSEIAKDADTVKKGVALAGLQLIDAGGGSAGGQQASGQSRGRLESSRVMDTT
ncbi:MAG: sulfotransferase family 2 domain-containing protein [Gammaproteobacteria bacterium]|nr:sulfotransferase family 2 domain-containing protein [Gammaproteobacteria bacterium]